MKHKKPVRFERLKSARKGNHRFERANYPYS
jgi:hypothetical protein